MSATVTHLNITRASGTTSYARGTVSAVPHPTKPDQFTVTGGLSSANKETLDWTVGSFNPANPVQSDRAGFIDRLLDMSQLGGADNWNVTGDVNVGDTLAVTNGITAGGSVLANGLGSFGTLRPVAGFSTIMNNFQETAVFENQANSLWWLRVLRINEHVFLNIKFRAPAGGTTSNYTNGGIIPSWARPATKQHRRVQEGDNANDDWIYTYFHTDGDVRFGRTNLNFGLIPFGSGQQVAIGLNYSVVD